MVQLHVTYHFFQIINYYSLSLNGLSWMNDGHFYERPLNALITEVEEICRLYLRIRIESHI